VHIRVLKQAEYRVFEHVGLLSGGEAYI